MKLKSQILKTALKTSALALFLILGASTISHAGVSGMPKGTPTTPADPNCPLPFPAQNLCGALVFAEPATVGKASKFELQFRNRTTGAPQDPAGDVGVFLWMEMMGHGSAPVAIAHTPGSGVYLITNAYFIMRGTWDIHVTVKSPDNSEEAITPVSI